MAFQEKSAWVMSLALMIGGAFYFGVVISASEELGRLAPPMIPLVAIYTIVLVILSIVGHTVIAIVTPREANAPLDEREAAIFRRAGYISAYITGFGVVTSLGLYLLSFGGDVLFYAVFASLMAGQLAEYLIRIILYRIAF